MRFDISFRFLSIVRLIEDSIYKIFCFFSAKMQYLNIFVSLYFLTTFDIFYYLFFKRSNIITHGLQDDIENPGKYYENSCYKVL